MLHLRPLGQLSRTTIALYHNAADLAREKERKFRTSSVSQVHRKYSSLIDFTSLLCYNFHELRREFPRKFDDGEQPMNAIFALVLLAVLISLLVRLMMSPQITKSQAMQCQHCHVC